MTRSARPAGLWTKACCTAIGIFFIICAVATALPAAAQTGPTHTTKPEVKACPEGVAQGSRCLTGNDSAGAYYWLAVPPE